MNMVLTTGEAASDIDLLLWTQRLPRPAILINTWRTILLTLLGTILLTFTGIAIFTAIGIAAAAAVWCIQLVSSRKSPERHRTWLAYMPALQVALAVMTVLAGVVAISTQNMVRLQYFVAFEDPHYWDMWGGLNMYLGLILVATGIGYGLLSLPLLITRRLSRWTQLVAFALVAVLDAVVSVIGIWAVMQ